jgi:Transglutaminase-like superfamily
VTDASLDFYSTPAAMTELPDHPALAGCPDDPDELRRVVQGLLVHRDWATAYGIPSDEVRAAEQNLRSTREVLQRAFELSSLPVTQPRAPIDRVLCVCRHFALLHTALLRARGVPARVRCGFSNYFDRTKWYDHWITERWDGRRWVRDDPQVDELQAAAIELDFDPYDQPPGRFLDGCQAWTATRAGRFDPSLFGIFDMWGQSFIAGNVLSDVACVNKVELLPWDGWGMRLEWGPHNEVPEHAACELDELCRLVAGDDVEEIRERYLTDDRLRVPADISTIVDGSPVHVHVDL